MIFQYMCAVINVYIHTLWWGWRDVPAQTAVSAFRASSKGRREARKVERKVGGKMERRGEGREWM
jgi:hypothetical protein